MSSLETSVTLEDVFTVVEAKRVPLAPELAGYLTLEIGDGTDAGSGDVDPKTVFISEEGTVALVRPKKDSVTGDAEASVRRLLAKLLEASGSGTPALSTAAKRKPGNGLPALVEELEAALIPVNRAAGRRALARLAREVKRVLLGVGRNASVPPVIKNESAPKIVAAPAAAAPPPLPAPAPAVASSGAAPHARPVLRKKDDAGPPGLTPPPKPDVSHATKEAALAALATPGAIMSPLSADASVKLEKIQADLAKDIAMSAAAARPKQASFGEEATTAKRALSFSRAGTAESFEDSLPQPPRANELGLDASADPKAVETKEPPAAAARAAAAAAAPLPPPSLQPKPLPAPPPPLVLPPGSPKRGDAKELVFGRDDVDSLLESFGVSDRNEEKQMSRELKAIAGLGPTPPPPDAKTLADLTKDIGKDLPRTTSRDSNAEGDSVEALLALAEASAPPTKAAPIPAFAPPAANRPAASSAKMATANPIDDLLAAAPPPQPVAAPPPPIAPPANLPPSPIFGPAPGLGAHAPANVPGAPAALRQSAEALPPHIPPSLPSTPRLPESSPRMPVPATAVMPSQVPPPQPQPRTEREREQQRKREKEAAAAAASSPAASQRGRSTDLTGPHKKRSGATDKRPRAPRTGMAMLIFALLVVGAGTVAIWKFAPHIFTGKKKPVPTVATSVAPVVVPPKCKVALVLTEVPANAEILLRMGQAPVDVERMPVGTRLELVATAEGYAPRRAVIKAESPWDKGSDGKPRIEIPIQLDPTKAKPGAVDPWPAAEPGSQVGGSGAPGTVHVVSNVRGAEVWLLAGLGPEARIDQLRCDADIDVLLAGPPALRRRLHIAEKDVGAVAPDANGNKVVSVTAKTDK